MAKMKKAALLGDSIRLVGYGKRCAELLGEEYDTFLPRENGMFAKYTLRMALYEWKPMLEGSDVIHWNNGLWDVCDLGDGPFSSVDEYVGCLLRIRKVLSGYARRIIFATTTPPSPKMPGHSIDRIREYNKAAVEALAPHGVIINDLFGAVIDDLEGNICCDMLHLSPKGVEICAKRTAEVIRSTAEQD